MSKRSIELLVEDILESIEKIERYTEGMTQDSFQNDDKTTDAVVRNLEIIGEAAGVTFQYQRHPWLQDPCHGYFPYLPG